jgi:subtilisin family serine protease
MALLAVVGAILMLHAGGVLAQERPHSPQVDIPGRYIVVLNDDVSRPGQVANQHADQHAAQVGFVYRHAIKGYSAAIAESRLRAIEEDPRVDYVEPDGVATAVAQAKPWGIDRIDADLSSTLAGNGSGAVPNVNAYIIDSGIAAGHADLNVVRHVTVTGSNKDCNGHGTHVAGTVAARDNMIDVVGVAPGAPLIGVKVLGCSGSGSWSGVIAGIDWVTQDAANRPGPDIANMSLGGGANSAVDKAVKDSAASGVFYSVAAGNSNADACNSSPARAGAGTNNGIATVAATDSADREASWSNYGSCVDIWAPGVSILSTRMGGGTTTMSGTSMASPHVAGAGALYLSTRTTNMDPLSVESALTSAATSTGTTSKDGRTITRENVGVF